MLPQTWRRAAAFARVSFSSPALPRTQPGVKSHTVWYKSNALNPQPMWISVAPSGAGLQPLHQSAGAEHPSQNSLWSASLSHLFKIQFYILRENWRRNTDSCLCPCLQGRQLLSSCWQLVRQYENLLELYIQIFSCCLEGSRLGCSRGRCFKASINVTLCLQVSDSATEICAFYHTFVTQWKNKFRGRQCPYSTAQILHPKDVYLTGFS